MREIKIRAWDKEMGEMLQVGQITFAPNCDRFAQSYLMDEHNDIHYLDDVELMQYTGLKDKNGTEIYEGDIVDLILSDGEKRLFTVEIKTVVRNVVNHKGFDGYTSRVAITAVVFKWNCFELFPCVDGNGIADNEKMEVIGNIYENSELLGGESS